MKFRKITTIPTFNREEAQQIGIYVASSYGLIGASAPAPGRGGASIFPPVGWL
jgi:hypothetical protein